MATNEIKSGRPKKGANPFTEIFRDLTHSQTQQEAANKIGVSRQNVGRWLSGDITPDIETLCKIADAYNVSTDYLLGRTPNKTTDTQLQGVCEYTGLSETAIKSIQNNTFSNEVIFCGRDVSITRRETTNYIIEKIINDLTSIICHFTLSYITTSKEKHTVNAQMQRIDKIKDKLAFLRLKMDFDNLEDTMEFSKWKAVNYFSNIIEQFAKDIYSIKDGEKDG